MEFSKGEFCDSLCLVEVPLRPSEEPHIESIENQTYVDNKFIWKKNGVLQKYNEKQMDENMNCKKKKNTRLGI